MGTFKKFDEYMNSRGKLVNKAPIKTVPDYDGPIPTAPTKGGKWTMKGDDGKMSQMDFPKKGDYQSTNKPLKPVGIGNGFGNKSAKGQEYNGGGKAIVPEKVGNGFGNSGRKAVPYPQVGKVSPDWSTKKMAKNKNLIPNAPASTWKTKTEQFIDKTSEMNLKEFTEYMLKECGMDKDDDNDPDTIPHVTAYAAGKFHPHPLEAIKYIVSLAKANPRIMDTLVHEVNRAGVMDSMFGSSLDHPESFDVLTDILGGEDGPMHSRSLARSMDDKYSDFKKEHGDDDLDESVGPPIGLSHEDDDEDDNQPDEPDQFDDGSDDTGSPDDTADPNAPTDGDDDQNTPNDGSQPDEQPDDQEGPPDVDHNDDEMKPKKKINKKFAQDHLLGAMSEYGHMKKKMKGYADNG